MKKAIKVFTLNGAHNIEAEDESRSMEVGKSEDFILLNQNLMEIPVEKIHKTKLMQTVLQGKTVYQRT